MILHQEHFEAWLFSQPDDTVWNYNDIKGCVVCSFGNDFYRRITSANSSHFQIWNGPAYEIGSTGEYYELPEWIKNLLGCAILKSPFIKASDLKQIYRDLFHEKNEADAGQPTHSPAPLVSQP